MSGFCKKAISLANAYSTSALRSLILVALLAQIFPTPAIADSTLSSNSLRPFDIDLIYPKIFAVRAELERVYQRPLREHLHLHFLPRKEFVATTGLTNGSDALYNQGHLFFAINPSRGNSDKKLESALRHELSHSFVGALSDSKCPAWLDEGLAQYFEGVATEGAKTRLRNWLKNGNSMLPLSSLNSNLTLLKSDLVGPAYAQSLYATQSLINKKGFSAVRAYLQALAAGALETQAFTAAFGFDRDQFELQLARQLKREIERR